MKVSILLEELGLPYEAHRVSFDTQDQFTPEFLSISPNNKIPAILDPNGPDGKPLALFESGAILVYLASKTGQFLPADAGGRFETLQWLMFQMGGIGPMFGQLGFFHKLPARTMKTSVRATATWPRRDACWACWTSACKAATGSWAIRTPSPTSLSSLGAQPDRFLRRGRAGRVHPVQECGARAGRFRLPARRGPGLTIPG